MMQTRKNQKAMQTKFEIFKVHIPEFYGPNYFRKEAMSSNRESSGYPIPKLFSSFYITFNQEAIGT